MRLCDALPDCAETSVSWTWAIHLRQDLSHRTRYHCGRCAFRRRGFGRDEPGDRKDRAGRHPCKASSCQHDWPHFACIKALFQSLNDPKVAHSTIAEGSQCFLISGTFVGPLCLVQARIFSNYNTLFEPPRRQLQRSRAQDSGRRREQSRPGRVWHKLRVFGGRKWSDNRPLHRLSAWENSAKEMRLRWTLLEDYRNARGTAWTKQLKNVPAVPATSKNIARIHSYRPSQRGSLSRVVVLSNMTLIRRATLPEGASIVLVDFLPAGPKRMVLTP